MSVSKHQESDVRIGHSLNDHEEEFVRRRLQTVQECLEKLDIHCSLDNVPKIALLGSGGGERAMLALLGSLVELDKTGLLNSTLYLSGVSGSTWCMGSLYQNSDWSTNLDSVKEKIIQRLKTDPGVSWRKRIEKLKQYYKEKDFFTLTDVWAALIVPSFLKEMDGSRLSEQQGKNNKDPFPIYTVTDKECLKQHHERDPWFELTPYEAGYSLTGAFVDVSKFGCKFEEGSEIKSQPEMDMLYLQGLCGSCLADRALIWEKIKELILHIMDEKDTTFPSVDDACLVLEHLVDIHISVLKGEEISGHETIIRTKLNELAGGEGVEKETFTANAKLNLKQFTLDVCERLKVHFSFWPFLKIVIRILECMIYWIWGTEYNFLYGMKDDKLPPDLKESKTRDYEDAGLSLNSPYFSMLRQERNIRLIISLDFSDGDPFKTVKEVAELCAELNIPFPEVNIPKETFPRDFYVFEGHGDEPTVIHIPLFNTVNCGDKVEEWRKIYRTIQRPYSADLIDPLLDVAGKNITNNKEKLIEKIRKIIWPNASDR